MNFDSLFNKQSDDGADLRGLMERAYRECDSCLLVT